MAKIETQHTFKGSLQKVFSGISQYDKYSQYLQEVKKVEVLDPEVKNSVCSVSYHVRLVKECFYKLHMFHEEPNKITWELGESDLFKKNVGTWEFTAQGKTKTQARYTLEVGFKLFIPVPDAMITSLTKATLPGMLEGLQNLINDYGRD